MATKGSNPEGCVNSTKVTKLEMAIDYIKESLTEMKEDLKAHIAAEDEQIDRIEKIVKDWSEKADKTYIKIETVKIVFYVVSVITTIIIGAWGLISFLHPLIEK